MNCQLDKCSSLRYRRSSCTYIIAAVHTSSSCTRLEARRRQSPSGDCGICRGHHCLIEQSGHPVLRDVLIPQRSVVHFIERSKQNCRLTHMQTDSKARSQIHHKAIQVHSFQLRLSVPIKSSPSTSQTLSSTPASIKTLQPIPDILLIQALIVLMPPTERRTTFSNVARGPHDSQLVELFAGFVVWADDVELSSADFVKLQKRNFSISAEKWWKY